jgi:hypothetical protein
LIGSGVLQADTRHESDIAPSNRLRSMWFVSVTAGLSGKEAARQFGGVWAIAANDESRCSAHQRGDSIGRRLPSRHSLEQYLTSSQLSRQRLRQLMGRPQPAHVLMASLDL